MNWKSLISKFKDFQIIALEIKDFQIIENKIIFNKNKIIFNIKMKLEYRLNNFLLSFCSKRIRKILKETNFAQFEVYYYMKEQAFKNRLLKEKRIDEKKELDKKKEIISKCPKKIILGIEVYNDEEDET